MGRLKTYLSILLIICLSWKAEAQTLTHQFIDPCTGQVTYFSVPATGTVVFFLGQSRQFTSADVANGINVVDLLVDKAAVFPSKTEARKMFAVNAVSISKTKVTDVNATINLEAFNGGKYLLVSKGKKENYLVKLV